jgi:hypothetical protein
MTRHAAEWHGRPLTGSSVAIDYEVLFTVLSVVIIGAYQRWGR